MTLRFDNSLSWTFQDSFVSRELLALCLLLVLNPVFQQLAAATIESDTHWSFIAPVRPPEPVVKQKNWPRNAIDRFVLARLEKEGIRPSVEADRVTLIRRLSLDLTGLPPRMDEVQAFLNDTRSDSYERLVDRLLASPHYGERWARHWLDAARYADSNGYSIDAPRSIWRYRDWVIDALNHDLPFDLFTIYQLAGDLLPEAAVEQKVATGFHRNTQINEEGGIDKEQFRVESVIDRVNTTATAFLGLTFGCAQCHDHKFDPFTQKDYFRFYAFLNNADEPTLELATPEEFAKRDAIRAQIKAMELEVKRYTDSHSDGLAEWEASLTAEARKRLKPDVRAALETPPDKRTERQKQAVNDLLFKDDASYRKLKTAMAGLQKSEPRFPTTMIMQERTEPRESYVFVKGDFTRKGEAVTPGVPKILAPLPPVEKPTRLDLARWIVSADNPLTARVIVNRIWQHYFGRGIVETENDFGTQGATPTHPELLDWLATEFLRQKWSLKAMHRLIVTSAAYRQSSRARPELETVDPNNRLLARQNRLRLDAEIVRDVALSASGLLSEKIGGPSVFPPLPDGVMSLGQVRREWKAQSGPDRHRRGMYTFFWRATPHPSLMVFDAPEASSACTRRIRSNTPLQALTLLNDEGFFELAEGLAKRVLREAPAHSGDRLEYAFRACLVRAPSAGEKQRLMQLLEQQIQAEAQNESHASEGNSSQPVDAAVSREFAAWTTVARVLLNLDECITRE
ncbi:MAG: DUF1553 domain-containing protein [Verrucomicrobia bacterium]|nr:DUF1553 domain-containing protein [Verrucomicrobiota bacterium]